MNRLLIASALVSLAACRGSVSEDPPVHIIPDMDWQDKYHPQGESAFFEDGRAMRTPVEGTVGRGAIQNGAEFALKTDAEFSKGKSGDAFVQYVPLAKVQQALKVDGPEQVLARGRERFNIYCAPCHDQTGSGNGLVVQHGYQRPPELAGIHALGISDGEIFDYITNGRNYPNMPAYAHQIDEADRWAIVSWVRVLQRSQHATVDDVPEQFKNTIEEGGAQ